MSRHSDHVINEDSLRLARHRVRHQPRARAAAGDANARIVIAREVS